MQAINPTQLAPGTRSHIHATHHVLGTTPREKCQLEG
jgi:hypothetical protein